MAQNIKKLGKGLVKQPEDPRDLNFQFVAAGAEPIEWLIPFMVEAPPDENQGISDSCVAQASSYFHWQLKRKKYSRRDLFSRIALSYGAFLRDGVKTICDIGQQTRDECPDPSPQTPDNMRVKSALPDSAGADDREFRYFSTGASIEQLAQAVRDWKGAVFGIYTYGWTNKDYPKPATKAAGGHALYAMGYHIHNDGKKCIIAKSSWCTSKHHEHHINEDHFTAGRVYDGWVLVSKTMPVQRYLVNKNGKLGVCVSVDGDGIFSDTIYWAKNDEHWTALKKFYEIPNDAKIITYPL